MKFKILHEIRGRLRVHILNRYSRLELDKLFCALNSERQIKRCKVYPATNDLMIEYFGSKEDAIKLLCQTEPDTSVIPEHALTSVTAARELRQEYTGKLLRKIAGRYLRRFFIPRYIRIAILAVKAARYIWKALRCLSKGKLEVSVLDATAITVSLIRRDFKTAGSVMFLLEIGEILEGWTHKKSISDLAGSMSLNVGKVWLKTGGQPVLVKSSEIQSGNEIIVNAGSMIPFDGTVSGGEAMVNQSTLTGEGVPVRRNAGATVYAGTVIEEGELTIRVTQNSGSTRYDKIVSMIEETEKLKSNVESRAEHLADRLVPFTFLGTEKKLLAISSEFSRLYLSIDGWLAAVICIEDPLREEAPAVVKQLKELGFDNIVMMTGDSKHTAKAIAERVGVDRFYAEVLPEEKAHFVLSEKAKGNTVVMIGDGVNDSPALSSADVGIAISNGAAIAREIADITISENDLGSIITLRKLSTAMMKRIGRNFRSIISVNGGLIALGVGGLAQPTTTATLHNASTLGIGLLSTKKLI